MNASNPNQHIELTEDDSNLLALWKLIIKAVKRMSVPRVYNLMCSVIANYELYESEYDKAMDYILDCVVEEYASENVKKEDLFDTKVRGETTNARRLCIIIIKEQLNIDHKIISNFFGRRTPVTVYKVMKDYENLEKLNKRNPQVRDFIQKHENVTKKVLPKIEELKKNQSLN